jgi:hypothetical protein
MKTKFFSTDVACNVYLQGRTRRFAPTAYCLLVLLTATFCAAAQSGNGVIVSGLVLDAGTVTFEVSWKNTGMPALWSDSVWVFVDYNDAGVMTRLPLSAGATLTATSAPGVGKVVKESDNDKGVWVVGNAKTSGAGSFSATVQLLTATATATGACVYASNYPPVGEYTSVTNISFTGTPPYEVVLKLDGGGTIIQSISSSSYVMPAGYTVESFTDKTGAPGFINCVPMSGDIDFAVPENLPGGQQFSFSVAENPSTPDVSAVTYTWSATSFTPATYTGTPFTTTAPSAPGTYPVTLTAHSVGYCDLPKTKGVPVVDCRSAAGWIGVSGVAGQCKGNSGGKIGI